MDKTTKKRPSKPFTGIEGKTFSSDYQPTPEQKKLGWEDRRKERLFTSAVWELLVGKDGLPLKEFTKKVITLAEGGNPKAIEKVLSAIEDETLKLDLSGETIIRIIRDREL